MRLDHISYAAPSGQLADVVQRLGSRLGAAFSDGGVHPRFGTRNFILPLAGGNYLEVVAALDHPAAENAAFGRAVKKRCTNGGGWLGWVVEVADIDQLESRLGRHAVPGHRRRPDGYDLRWRQIGVYDLLADPQLPFFIHWESDAAEHPGRHASNQLRLVKLEIAGEAETINNWLGESNGHPLDEVDVEWVEPHDDEVGLVAAHFSTPQGVVRVD